MSGSSPARPLAGPAGAVPALAPPWAVRVAAVALAVGTLLAGLVWHATQLNSLDAWALRWQELAFSHAHRVAETVSGVLPPAVLVITVAAAALAWRAGRRDAVALALTAAPATLATELLLKRIVQRRWYGDPSVLFPSGHAAVATAAATTVVLVLRVVPAAPLARVVAAWLSGVLVLVIAAARLVETVHPLTDVLGGGATGLVVTLGAASAITALSGLRCGLPSSVVHGASSRSTRTPRVPPPASAGRGDEVFGRGCRHGRDTWLGEVVAEHWEPAEPRYDHDVIGDSTEIAVRRNDHQHAAGGGCVEVVGRLESHNAVWGREA